MPRSNSGGATATHKKYVVRDTEKVMVVDLNLIVFSEKKKRKSYYILEPRERQGSDTVPAITMCNGGVQQFLTKKGKGCPDKKYFEFREFRE